MSFTQNLHLYWKQMTTDLFNEVAQDEKMVLNLHGEDSEFIRFNHCKIRQNSSVQQIGISLELQKNQRNTTHKFSLSGHHEVDFPMMRAEMGRIRKELTELPENPFLVEMKNHGESSSDHQGEKVSHQVLLETLTKHQDQMDLAGFFCQGPVVQANANSLKQNHWFSTENFFFDYSLYNGPRAVKSGLSGSKWSPDRLEVQLQEAKNQLALLQRPKRKIAPGNMRTYFGPKAVHEILNTISWGGLSENSFRQGQNGFQKAVRGEETLSPKFSLKENFHLGLCPRFNELGELAADELNFFEQGQFKQFLISSETAKEYQLQGNSAPASESPRNLELMAGQLDEKDILKQLGTGLYLSNLHYLNWSDRNAGRITGMTRYACFLVENGEVVAPIDDLRFDDSVFNLFGKNLVDLTKTQEIIPETGTYFARNIGGMKVPGMLVDGFQIKS